MEEQVLVGRRKGLEDQQQERVRVRHEQELHVRQLQVPRRLPPRERLQRVVLPEVRSRLAWIGWLWLVE